MSTEIPTNDMVHGIAQMICEAVEGRIHTGAALEAAQRIVSELATAPCDLPSVDEVARVAWAAVYGTDDFDETLARCSDDLPGETPSCISDQRKEALAALTLIRNRVAPLIAAKDARIAALESPDGENLYDGCLCGGISPEDKPCLTCAARLSQWDAMAAELALRRKRRFIGRHEEETGVYCGDYNQHRETGWACNACGVFSRNEHDACENCDNDFIRLENENRGLRERIAKLESEGAALFASEQAAVRLATEASALANHFTRFLALHTSPNAATILPTLAGGAAVVVGIHAVKTPKCRRDCEWCT